MWRGLNDFRNGHGDRAQTRTSASPLAIAAVSLLRGRPVVDRRMVVARHGPVPARPGAFAYGGRRCRVDSPQAAVPGACAVRTAAAGAAAAEKRDRACIRPRSLPTGHDGAHPREADLLRRVCRAVSIDRAGHHADRLGAARAEFIPACAPRAACVARPAAGVPGSAPMDAQAPPSALAAPARWASPPDT